MNIDWKRVIGIALSSVIFLFGVFLVVYDLYWLSTREGSSLGVGIALMLIAIGALLATLGGFGLYKLVFRNFKNRGFTI